MKELELKIPAVEARSYKIKIAANILDSVWDRIESTFGGSGKFIITDENLVLAGHLAKLLGGREIPNYVITPAGEISKNISTVNAIIEQMERLYFGRDSVVVALGGGTVGDIAGFAAAIFKRGVPVIQIPTTTVSQADSAIGGKTGVDSSVSKNAFGVFWHPSAVYIDVAVLQTLNDRQYRAGLVESVKQALIADEQYFTFLEQNIETVLERNFSVLEKVAYYNCKVKAGVVESDPREANQRRILNYGHTIGHAAEQVSGFELLHGEAVAIGMIGAGMIEIEMGLSDGDRLERVKNILEKLKVPVKLPSNLAKDKLLASVKRDKKAVAGWPKFVLLERIGHVHCQEGQWAVDAGQDVVEKVLDKL